jgi:signal transduction histidine kinase
LRIKSSVSNLTAILNDFLSLDKLEQGIVEIEQEVFDVTEFMNEVVEDVRFLQRKGQQINFVHNGDPQVTLDQKKLRYIMVNLVSNSMKYSTEDTEINLYSACQGGRLTIIVQDRGIGIPEEEQKYMFNKFFRAKNTGNVQGTGLGLTIVKRYVELMNGNIKFTSRMGEGTAFTIELPKM